MEKADHEKRALASVRIYPHIIKMRNARGNVWSGFWSTKGLGENLRQGAVCAHAHRIAAWMPSVRPVDYHGGACLDRIFQEEVFRASTAAYVDDCTIGGKVATEKVRKGVIAASTSSWLGWSGMQEMGVGSEQQ